MFEEIDICRQILISRKSTNNIFVINVLFRKFQVLYVCIKVYLTAIMRLIIYLMVNLSKLKNYIKISFRSITEKLYFSYVSVKKLSCIFV